MRVVTVIAMTILATQALAAPVMPSADVVEKIQAVLDLRRSAREKAAALREDTEDLEKEIGLRDKDGRLQPIDSAGVTEYAKRLLGLNTEKVDKYMRQIQEYKLAQEDFNSLTTQAITMASAEYGSAPVKTTGNIVSGPPTPRSDDDVPSYLGNTVTLTPRYTKNLPKDTWGSTDDAGNVLIGEDAFDSPGRLAFTLYHEGEHFERLLTRGLDLRNNPKDEVLARTRQRPLLKSSFGLADDEITRFDEKLKSERIRAKTWDAALAQGLTPYKKSHQPAFPGSYKPLWMDDGASREVESIIARTRELREQERAEAERRRQEEEAERVRRAEAEWRMTQYRYAAANCGMTPKMTRDGLTYGFKDNGNVNVNFTEPVNLEQAIAAMVMARACSDGEQDNPQTSPCADALGAMQVNWGNTRFRQGLELDADSGHIDGCLRAIRENGQAPGDMRTLNKRISRHLREWKDANRRRELERQDARAREREEGGRRARGDAEERSGQVPDQNYDLTPARRALENARRSHF